MRLILTTIALFTVTLGNAQKWFTKSGNINFTSKTTSQTIEAINKTASCVLDAKTGSLNFIVQIKGFVFQKKLMQDHFNENYMESDKFPKATFQGTITNNSTVNYTTDGNYNVDISGKLTIHGITKDINTTGKITITQGKIMATSTFVILLSDYGIAISPMAANSISKNINIDVNTELEPLDK